MDEDVFYLGVTIAIVILAAAAHNVMLKPRDTMSFGYCDTTISCTGIEAGDTCLGVEQRQTRCYDPSNTDSYRRIEAECGVLAQNYCTSGNYTGTGWADEAMYNNTTCRQWKQRRPKVTLLSCDQTFPPAYKWKTIG